MFYFIGFLIATSVFFATFGYSVYKNTFSNKEMCWGKKIYQSKIILVFRKAFPIGFIAMGIFFVLYMVVYSKSDFWEIDIIETFFILFGCSFIPIPIGMISGSKWSVSYIEKQKYAIQALGGFSHLSQADEFKDKTCEIEIFADGIALSDSVGYRFKEIVFQEYSLGNLNNGKQLIMVATYFMQSNPKKYKMKIIETLSTHNPSGNNAADLGGTTVAVIENASGKNIHSIKLVKK